MSIEFRSDRAKERGATLVGYALTMAAITVVGLGSMVALETYGGEFLANTGNQIGAPRESAEDLARTEVASYGLQDSTGSGASTTTTTTTPPTTTTAAPTTTTTAAPTTTTTTAQTTTTTAAPTTTSTTQPPGNPPDGVLPSVIGDCLGEPGITALELRTSGWADFTGCDLGVYGPLDLSGFDLSDAQIEGGDWDGTIFDGANLFKTEFKLLSMTNSSFVGASVQELFVKDFSMVGADFSGTDLTKARFDTGSLIGADFSFAVIDDVEFKVVDAGGASFDGATIVGTKMEEMGALDASFAGATLEGVDLDKANLRNANFDNADLSNVDMREANILNATFLGADLDDLDIDKSTGVAQLGTSGTWITVKCPNGDDDTDYRECWEVDD